jgi:hypothetical protein
MKLIMESWRSYINEEDEEASQFRLVKPTLLQLTTEQDGASRDIVIVVHPDQTVKAYFKSSGVSGGGYKGNWIPFEGWATFERVPKGQTFTDGGKRQLDETTWVNQPYGYYALMAKTYWNVGSAKPPAGSIHDQAAQWISTLDELPEDQKPQVKKITAKRGVENNIKLFSKLNGQLHRLGAIDHSANVLSVKPRGRRLLFGFKYSE